jgi:hypothetical protein
MSKRAEGRDGGKLVDREERHPEGKVGSINCRDVGGKGSWIEGWEPEDYEKGKEEKINNSERLIHTE